MNVQNDGKTTVVAGSSQSVVAQPLPEETVEFLKRIQAVLEESQEHIQSAEEFKEAISSNETELLKTIDRISELENKQKELEKNTRFLVQHFG